jgi:Mg-chelatase subunit ChlD
MKQRRKLQSDIVLCLDISGSMSAHNKLTYAKLAASGLAKAALENGDRVGIAAFSNIGQTVIPLTDKDEDTILNYIAKLSARANTNIGDGIKCASELLFHNQSRNQKYIVLITDGQPTAISEGVFDQLKEVQGSDLTEQSAILETKKASAKGIRVSVIYISGEGRLNNNFVKNVARIGKGKVLHMSSLEDLKTIVR